MDHSLEIAVQVTSIMAIGVGVSIFICAVIIAFISFWRAFWRAHRGHNGGGERW